MAVGAREFIRKCLQSRLQGTTFAIQVGSCKAPGGGGGVAGEGCLPVCRQEGGGVLDSPQVWMKEALPESVITVFAKLSVAGLGCRALESLAAGLRNTWRKLEGRWSLHRAPKPPPAATTGWTSLRSGSTCATAQGRYCRSSLEAKVGKKGGSAGHHLGYRGQGCKVADPFSLAMVVQQLRCNTSTVARRERCGAWKGVGGRVR